MLIRREEKPTILEHYYITGLIRATYTPLKSTAQGFIRTNALRLRLLHYTKEHHYKAGFILARYTALHYRPQLDDWFYSSHYSALLTLLDD
ncbi:hypothetical protein CHS0354_040638 [Potamilus streckersoni]|uniref:Uncharacterized protein n=1 Tax=Potamilus streckersoni TaxID=2493646 RepID=A0AAE0TD51_9BIVA|nr:hypothetical protein CHS0354_040638 [Potamilus streckersoni]